MTKTGFSCEVGDKATSYRPRIIGHSNLIVNCAVGVCVTQEQRVKIPTLPRRTRQGWGTHFGKRSETLSYFSSGISKYMSSVPLALLMPVT
jgi:hypothetical protein